ncbi:MAG: hypothetical protein HYV68_01705 [Candidatus Taylorbacteria bacterium]|nr:hypothetical protein [Candidatus Taylorbacteria bacterium]
MAQADWTKNIIPGHHAYLIAGTEAGEVPILLDYLQREWEIEVSGNPDLMVQHFPTLYIENCHDIEKKALNKAIGRGPKIFIVSFGFMTRESANALLKLFEEPTGTIFFAVTPNPERLPPTLLSRFVVVRSGRVSSPFARQEAKEFIGMPIGQRFEFSKKFAADVTNEKRTRADALGLIEAIEEILHEEKSLIENRAIYKELETCRSYIKDQSSSVKIILDQVGLTL